jgi:hypothetical protein
MQGSWLPEDEHQDRLSPPRPTANDVNAVKTMLGSRSDDGTTYAAST